VGRVGRVGQVGRRVLWAPTYLTHPAQLAKPAPAAVI
jgi:hypothetical protein